VSSGTGRFEGRLMEGDCMTKEKKRRLCPSRRPLTIEEVALPFRDASPSLSLSLPLSLSFCSSPPPALGPGRLRAIDSFRERASEEV